VRINTFGSVNKTAGWNSRDVEVDLNTTTIEEVLRAVRVANGSTLYDLIGDGYLLKSNYAIFLNGRLVEHPVDLSREINNKDEINILDFPFTLGGG